MLPVQGDTDSIPGQGATLPQGLVVVGFFFYFFFSSIQTEFAVKEL